MTPYYLSCKLVLLTVFVLGARVSSESPSYPEAGEPDPQDDAELFDLMAEESHPSFSYLAPPPDLKAPPPRDPRNWRFGHAPRRLPAGVNAPPSLPGRHASQYANVSVNLDFRHDPFANKREYFGPPPPRRPNHGHNFNPYATLDDSRKNYLPTPQRPQAPFSGFQTANEPSSSQHFSGHGLHYQKPYDLQGHQQQQGYHNPRENHGQYDHDGRRQQTHNGQHMYHGQNNNNHGQNRGQNNLQEQRNQHVYYIPEERPEEREEYPCPTGFQVGGLTHGEDVAQLDTKDLPSLESKGEILDNEQDIAQNGDVQAEFVNIEETATQRKNQNGDVQAEDVNIEETVTQRKNQNGDVQAEDVNIEDTEDVVSQRKQHSRNDDVPEAQPNPPLETYQSVTNEPTELPKVQDDEMESLDSSSNPRNLAALLAGVQQPNHEMRTTKLKRPQERKNAEHRKTPSKTRTSIPEHMRSTTSEDTGVEYYDDLYDEFVDMYFDPEGKAEEPSAKEVGEKTSPQPRKQSESENSKSATSTSEVKNTENESPKKVELREKHKTIRLLTTRGTTPKPILTARTSSMPTKIRAFTRRKTPLTSTTRKESVKEETTPPSRGSSSAISLSEILQELGLGLPQFLGTLKVHGTSLKEFTEKLKEKSLSKSEFRRAKGNVKKLLEILDGNLDRNVMESDSQLPTTKSFSQTLKYTTPSLPATTTEKSSDSEIVEKETTTDKSEESDKSNEKKPRIFGSRPTGLMFARPNMKKSKSEDSDGSSLTHPNKRPIAVDLDISKLVKEKGVSADGILQNFKTMFNISEKSSSESNEKENISVTSRTTAETTVSLRPYRTGAERSRIYRPTSFERGNKNIHRGIINSRHGSTARPTIRPPYVPRPPSINFGETTIDEDSKEVLDDSENKPESESTASTKVQDEASNKLDSRFNNDVYNYNLVKADPEAMNVSTRSAIMAAGILGGVALSVFIAIFIVVKYRNHLHRHRRRIPLTLPSDSSSSSLPPIYSSRNVYSKECYQTSGFWTTLKKRFDPYSPSSSPTSM